MCVYVRVRGVWGADIREKVCLMSALFSMEQLSGTGCRNKKKHLICPPPHSLPLTKHLQWLENQWLAESPEHHQISVLIASGLTRAIPGRGTPGEGAPHETRVRSTRRLEAPLFTEQETIINNSYSMLVNKVFNRSSTSNAKMAATIKKATFTNMHQSHCFRAC